MEAVMYKTRYEKFDTYENIYRKDISLPCAVFKDVSRKKTGQYNANWHEDPEIQYIVSGSGFVFIDGERFNVEPGDIIIANPNCVHYTGTEDEMKYTALIINSDFVRYADINLSSITYQTLIKSERIERLFSNIVAVYGEEGRVCKKARLQSALLQLLVELTEWYSVNKNIKPSTSTALSQIKKTIVFIRNNFNKKISLDMLSDNVFVDKYTLARNFKSATGQTIIDYINSYRCEQAKILIKNGIPVSEAAQKCGFNNMSFFTKTFKNFTGKLPSEYKTKK
jgi:AraC-like DNA-binding protein